MRHRTYALTITLAAAALNTAIVSADTVFQDGFELCRVAGVVEWDGGGDGTSWSDPLNWEGDNLPVNGDAVAIRMPDSLTVEYAGLNTTLSCLGVTSNLLVSNGSLVLDGPATVTANMAITNGNVTISARMSIVGMLEQQPSGTVDGAGTLTVEGPFNWSGGSQLGTGETIANGGIQISGTNNKGLSERTLSLNAAGSITGSGAVTLRWGSTINMNAPFDIASDADFEHIQGGAPTMNITGSLTKSAGTDLTEIEARVNNDGIVALNSGQLSIGSAGGSGSSSGEFTIAPGSTLTVYDGHTFGGLSSLGGGGSLVLWGGTSVMQGVIALSDVTLSAPGTVLEPQPGTTFNGNLTLANGVLRAAGAIAIDGTLDQQPTGIVDGAGTVTVGGLFSWSGGSQLDAGETIANGGIQISGTNNKGLSERTLSLNAASSITGSGAVTLRWGSTINMNAPFDIASDADFEYIQGGVPTINITDILTKSAGAGIAEIAADVQNTGSIAVASGQLSFPYSYEQGVTGNLDVNIAGDADFDVFPVTNGATLDGTLNINLNGGYEPLLDQVFEIITASSVTGTFATVNDTAIVAGRKFDVIYGANNVTLKVVAE